MTHDSLPVSGMTCASCVGRVERAIRKVPGVREVAVNLATERAEIGYDGPAATAAVVAAVEKAGYGVPPATVDLSITGMTCATCVARVEKAALAVPGVTRAAVNLATERATVTGQGDPAALAAAVAAAIARAGYGAAPVTAGDSGAEVAREADRAALRRDLIVAAVLTLPLFVVEMGGHLVPAFHHWLMMAVPTFPLRLAEFVLATAVLFGPGLRFWRKGLASFRALSPDMNALVITGAGAAWAFSTVATFAPGLLPPGGAVVYFESAAVIVTLILLGKYLESLARGRTSEAIRHLMRLAPDTARVVRNGSEADLALAEVRPGDLIRIRPGDRVPVDGTIIEGSSFLDESMLTGEPLPVERGPGAPVTAGTVNGTGSFLFRAERVGAETVLAQIVRMVEAAQGAKLPVQAAVDRVTAWFVPAVMAIALVTVILWAVLTGDPALALVNGVAVLIIACPCAMGLATPVSIMVGTGRAAELGVLFRNGAALQALAGVATVAFDKTGTLTEGTPVLTDLVPAPGQDRAAVLRLAGAAEAGSEHPVAQAITAAARAEGALPAAQGFEAVPGMGLRATVEGQRVEIGAGRFMAALGIDTAPLDAAAADLAQKARSPLFVALDGRLAALVAVADRLRPATPAAVAALHRLGLATAMLTGDAAPTAAAIGAEAGIDLIRAEILPAGKVAALRDLPGPVAFTGDGINDAPALAEADVGIAVGSGTDVAIESADVVLTGGDLAAVPRAVGLARAVMRNIRQNLFWAFAYNAALIPVAAGVLYPATGILLSPMLAAGAMALSSVFVLSNALRLRRWSPERRMP